MICQFSRSFLVALAATAVPSTAQTLLQAVPADVHVFVQSASPPSANPGWAKLSAAYATLADSGVFGDMLELATLDMPVGQRQQVRDAIAQVVSIFGRVEWSELFSREFAFCQTLALPLPDYTMLMRAPDGSGARHAAQMGEMLSGFAELSQGMAEVRVVERSSGDVTMLHVSGSPVTLAYGAVGDVLVMSTSVQSASASMQRLQAADGAGSLEQDPRMMAGRQALGATDGDLSFVDVHGLFEFVSGLIGMAEIGVTNGAPPEAVEALALVRAVFEELDVLDHMVGVMRFGDSRVESEATIALRDGEQDAPAVRLFSEQGGWPDWHRFVPVDATSFVFDSGIDLAGLLDWLEMLMEETTDSIGERWAESRVQVEMRRIADHLSGEVASVSFPTAGADGCAAGELVCWLRLDRVEGVDGWLQRHLEAAARHVRNRGQAIEIVTKGGLHELRIAAFPWIRPVLGVRDGHVVLATSPAALEAIDRVRAGQAKDIRSNPRFAALGLGTGPSSYVSYGQHEHEGGAVANLLGAFGFFLSVAPPEQHDTKPAILLGGILTKLAPVLRDLGQSYDVGVEWTRTDAGHVRQRSVFVLR